jgi:hypothetical protein
MRKKANEFMIATKQIRSDIHDKDFYGLVTKEIMNIKELEDKHNENDPD